MTPRRSRPQPGAGQWKQGEYGTVAVTGATGFIGAHLVAKLAEHGERVRVLVRDTRRLANLVGLDVEAVRTDLADRDAVREALKGCGLLFHVAGEISGRDRERLWAINSFTPAAVVEAAAAAGVQRVVVTSTASAVGPAPGGEQTTEESLYQSAGFLYVDSKQAGETAALDAGQRVGVDVVITNPTYCLGNALNTSLRGAPSTRLVGNYVRGRLPAVIDTYNNFVDVEDVATGHLLAARYGKAGHRYLLGSQDLTWTQFIRQLRQVHDTRQPIVVLPRGIERVAERKRLLGLRNPLPREAIRLMARDWKYSSDKATSELGYHPRPIDESVARTVAWYQQLCAEGAFPHDGGRRRDLVHGALRLVERTPLAGGRGPLTFV